MSTQSQALCLQWNRTATAERIANWRSVLGEIFQHLFWLVVFRRSLAESTSD